MCVFVCICIRVCNVVYVYAYDYFMYVHIYVCFYVNLLISDLFFSRLLLDLWFYILIWNRLRLGTLMYGKSKKNTSLCMLRSYSKRLILWEPFKLIARNSMASFEKCNRYILTPITITTSITYPSTLLQLGHPSLIFHSSCVCIRVCVCVFVC